MDLRFAAQLVGNAGRGFLAGWMEGRSRYHSAGSPDVIPGSIFKPGSVEFAASQAAVAYHLGLAG